MAAAIVVPTAWVLLLCRIGVPDLVPWFSTSRAGVAMFLGMFLGYMLYRRDMYTSAIRWPGSAGA